VQVETTMLLMPALIAETELLSFISRHHLQGWQRGGARSRRFRRRTPRCSAIGRDVPGTQLRVAGGAAADRAARALYDG
jgi:hypothetical protein